MRARTHTHAHTAIKKEFPSLGRTLNEKCPTTITHSNIVLATV